MTDSFGNTSGPDRTRQSVPIVSSEIIASQHAEPPDFEKLFGLIKIANPKLVQFIMGRAEQLAPGDIRTKERIITVAIETMGLLRSQIEADDLDNLLLLPSEPDTPSASDGGGEELPR